MTSRIINLFSYLLFGFRDVLLYFGMAEQLNKLSTGVEFDRSGKCR